MQYSLRFRCINLIDAKLSMERIVKWTDQYGLGTHFAIRLILY